MTRRLRAAWRLARCTVHVLHGLAHVLPRFGRFDAAQRHASVRWWSIKLLRLLGVGLQVEGAEHLHGAGAGGTLLAANHVSWLDIMAIHAVCPQARFVSKSAVKAWPLLSQLADAGGTLYLERERKRDALRVVHVMAEALARGETIAVFPEGTTSDGQALLPFHANLLQAAIATGAAIQPVALRFSEPGHAISPAAEFIGRTTLVQSMWRLAMAEGLRVRVQVLPRLSGAGADRRALSAQLQALIDAALARPPAQVHPLP